MKILDANGEIIGGLDLASDDWLSVHAVNNHAKVIEALELAKGRLELLINRFPTPDLDSDHPVATEHILARVSAALAAAKGEAP